LLHHPPPEWLVLRRAPRLRFGLVFLGRTLSSTAHRRGYPQEDSLFHRQVWGVVALLQGVAVGRVAEEDRLLLSPVAWGEAGVAQSPPAWGEAAERRSEASEEVAEHCLGA
jgi:hypothetical protein